MLRCTQGVILALPLLLAAFFGEVTGSKGPSSKPNVLVIMTDDQDVQLDSLSVQPNIRQLFGQEGLTYDHFYCTVSYCCPSRVNFFTGRAAHNTNVTALTPPYGGWPKFQEENLDKNYLPIWLQAAGVNTYYVGKFLNGFSIKNDDNPTPPAGWTNSTFLVDPYTYNYLNSHWTSVVDAHGKRDVEGYKGIHTSTVTEAKGLAMIEEAVASGKQWYMQIAPVAPHLQVGGSGVAPPIPPGYDGLYNNRTIPDTPNFNPKRPSGASWIYNLPRLDSKELDEAQTIFYHRLANLAYIDAIVLNFVNKLQSLGQLDNTYVFYTTDNGFHIGQHRLPAGKRCPFETDINIPMLLRGPNVPQGVTTSYVTSHTDMAPTILQMLGVPTRSDFDGQPLPYTSSSLNAAPNNTELVNVEFWSGVGQPQAFKGHKYYNNTYKALRMVSGGYSFLYTSWCTGQREFYNMVTDPSQMDNRLHNPPQGSAQKYYGRSEQYLYTRLNALLMVTKSCMQEACRAPWSVLFPGGQVSALEEAMGAEYDVFFASQPQVSFNGCPIANFLSEEGPQNIIPFTTKNQIRGRGVRWLDESAV